MKQSNKTFYEFLEILPTASDEIVKAAVKAKLKKHHPDRGGTASAARTVLRAKDMLLHPDNRRRYDQALAQRINKITAAGEQQSSSAGVEHTQLQNSAISFRIKPRPVRERSVVRTPDGFIGTVYLIKDGVACVTLLPHGLAQYSVAVLSPFNMHHAHVLPPRTASERLVLENIEIWTKRGMISNFRHYLWYSIGGNPGFRRVMLAVMGVCFGWFLWPVLFLKHLYLWRHGVPFEHQLRETAS